MDGQLQLTWSDCTYVYIPYTRIFGHRTNCFCIVVWLSLLAGTIYCHMLFSQTIFTFLQECMYTLSQAIFTRRLYQLVHRWLFSVIYFCYAVLVVSCNSLAPTSRHHIEWVNPILGCIINSSTICLYFLTCFTLVARSWFDSFSLYSASVMQS